jgi:26S proteasome regulatory subunit N1
VALAYSCVLDSQLKQQLAYILSRQQVPFTSDEEAAEQEESILHITDENLLQILGRTQLSTYYKEFGKELSILEPRSLEDVYKSHMENSRSTAPANVDSAKQNLAGTFVNAFVNAGFGNDKLVADVEGGQSWIYKNKDHGTF